MAQRIPFELWNAILLMNDDVELMELDLWNYSDWPSQLATTAHPNVVCTLVDRYVEFKLRTRRPKPSAMHFRHVCRRWHDAVDRDCRLWVTQLWIMIGRLAESAVVSELFSKLQSLRVLEDSMNSDIDIHLGYLDFDTVVADTSSDIPEPLFDFLRDCMHRWRYVSLPSGSPTFISRWMQLEPTLPVLSRLQYFEFRPGLAVHDFGSCIRAPVLHEVHIESGNEMTTCATIFLPRGRDMGLIHNLRLHHAFVKERDYGEWLELLLSSLPNLRKLAIHTVDMEDADSEDYRAMRKPTANRLIELRLEGIWRWQRRSLDFISLDTILSLDINGADDSDDDQVTEWERTSPVRAPSVTNLIVKNQNSEILQLLFGGGSGFPSLNTLSISHCPTSFLPPARIRLAHLHHLYITARPGARATDVFGWLDAPQLRTLISPSSFHVNLDTAKHSPVSLPSLTSISIPAPCSITPSGLVPFFLGWDVPSLRSLSIFSGTTINPATSQVVWRAFGAQLGQVIISITELRLCPTEGEGGYAFATALGCFPQILTLSLNLTWIGALSVLSLPQTDGDGSSNILAPSLQTLEVRWNDTRSIGRLSLSEIDVLRNELTLPTSIFNLVKSRKERGFPIKRLVFAGNGRTRDAMRRQSSSFLANVGEFEVLGIEEYGKRVIEDKYISMLASFSECHF
jgi:hypothetical protein